MLTYTPREFAKHIFAQPGDWQGKALRALVNALRKENNLLRARFRLQDAIIASSNLPAAFKTAWASLPSMPDREIEQVKAALEAALDDEGDVV